MNEELNLESINLEFDNLIKDIVKLKSKKEELIKENLSLRDQISVMKTLIENYKRLLDKEEEEKSRLHEVK